MRYQAAVTLHRLASASITVFCDQIASSIPRRTVQPEAIHVFSLASRHGRYRE
jgi:hypothetical protein